MFNHKAIAYALLLALTSGAILSGKSLPEGAGQPVILSSGHQLFLDDYCIASMSNVARRINSAQKYPDNPIIKPDLPWEKSLAILFGSVLYDDEDRIYKMWYFTGGGHVAYATSADGIQWEKPALDVITYEGRRTNLVVQRGAFGHYYELFDVIKDANERDPARRYKMTFVSIQFNVEKRELWSKFNSGQRRSLGTAVSPDGIHWTLLNNWANEDIGDISHSFFNPYTKKYAVYGRTKHIGEELLEKWGDIPWFKKYYWGRAVALTESDDFEKWTPAELVFYVDPNDPPGMEIYSMAVFPYENMYIGLVQTFYGSPGEGVLDIQLAVSRDGRKFTRVGDRKPFIPLGGIGEWDRYNTSVSSHPVVRADEIWFYYGGRIYRHGPYAGPDSGPYEGYIGIAKIKKDRFVSLEASFDGGTVMMKPVTIKGKQLHINANAEFGSLQIEMLDPVGQLIPECKTTIEKINAIDIPLSFGNKKPGELEGKTVLLRFTLRNAQLYAVWAE